MIITFIDGSLLFLAAGAAPSAASSASAFFGALAMQKPQFAFAREAGDGFTTKKSGGHNDVAPLRWKLGRYG